MRTYREDLKAEIKLCKEKLQTVPKKHHPYWNRMLEKAKKKLYGA